MKKREQVIYLLPFETVKSLSFFFFILRVKRETAHKKKRWELTLAGCLDARSGAGGHAKHLYLLELI